jgi:transposase
VFDFHPVACWPDSGNQKGSVESLVKFVKINFLVGRTFIDDADLEVQCDHWQARVNTERVSQATDVTPGWRGWSKKPPKAVRSQ